MKAMVRPVGEETAEIDDGEAIPWWPTGERGRGGSRSGLSRQRIIEAGVVLVGEEGFEALTMRRVADSLRCGVMSLYWYVANRDELVSVVVDELLRAVPTPSPGAPWRHQVVEVCRAFVSILQPHRRVLAGFPGGIVPGPQLLRMTNDVYGALGSAGFAGEDLFRGVDAISWLTIGSLFAGSPDAGSGEGSGQQNHSGVAPCSVKDVDFSVLEQSRYPNLVAAGRRRGEGDDGFEFALDVLLDGLELRLRRGRYKR
jgi:AcrR family transcriptional regulator